MLSRPRPPADATRPPSRPAPRPRARALPLPPRPAPSNAAPAASVSDSPSSLTSPRPAAASPAKAISGITDSRSSSFFNTVHRGAHYSVQPPARSGILVGEEQRQGLQGSSKAPVITGIDDRRYWVHMPTTESRFHSVASLQQILWFEVVGEFDFCFPTGTYSLYFRLHLGKASKCFGRRVCSSEHIHGWDKKPVRFQLSTSEGQLALSQCYLDEPGSWILYHVSDFVASKPEQPVKLKFSVAQMDCTHTKGGLCVDSVLIYPKGFQQEKVARAQK